MTGGGSGPARRAVLRWAWRLFRRDWRQQLLTLSLVTIVVAGAVTLAASAVNAASEKSDDFGAGGALARAEVDSPEKTAATIAAAEQQFGQIEVVRHFAMAVPGTREPLDVRAQDPLGVFSRPLLDLRRGRYPRNGDEVALTKGAAALLAADIGDRVTIAGRERIVVGRVENPGDLHDRFALLAPGDDAPATSLTILLASGHRRDRSTTARADGAPAGPPPIQFAVQVGGDSKKQAAAIVLAVTTLAMALVALVAAAGFLVVAQRRQRQLGLLAALGAGARYQRLVLLANGALVGVVAAIVGAGLGVLAWLAVAPAVETAAAHRINRLDLPYRLILQCMALAVLASTAAAWWPARTLTRQPIMSTLSRRPSERTPVRRSTAAAVVLVAAGVFAIAAAFPSSERVRPLLLMTGLATLVVGVVLTSPLAIRALAAPAARMPLPTRLALRDLVRYQSRAAAALAAITLGLGISVAVVVTAKASEYRTDEGNLSPRQLVVRVADDRPQEITVHEGSQPKLDAAASTIAGLLGDPKRIPLDRAVGAAATAEGRAPVTVVTKLPDGYRFRDSAYVATPSLLEFYGITPSSIAADVDLLTTLTDDVFLFDPTMKLDPRTSARPNQKVQHVDLTAFTSAPTSLVTQGAMRRQGWDSVRDAWLLEANKAVTGEQLRLARAAAAQAGMTVEARSGQDDLAAIRTGATGIGALLALAIIAMTMGLIRGESAADLRTLMATGAAARTRRALTANTAGTLALLGAILGTAGAYLALGASYHAELTKLMSPPLAQLAIVAIGIPMAAASAGWLLAGREPRTFARPVAD